MSDKFKQIETKLIHAGEPHPRIKGAVSMPVFQSANYEYAGEESYHE
nr:PLP-dependent transferase [Fodinibius sp.]